MDGALLYNLTLPGAVVMTPTLGRRWVRAWAFFLLMPTCFIVFIVVGGGVEEGVWCVSKVTAIRIARHDAHARPQVRWCGCLFIV